MEHRRRKTYGRLFLLALILAASAAVGSSTSFATSVGSRVISSAMARSGSLHDQQSRVNTRNGLTIPTWSQSTSLPAGRVRPAVAVGHDGNVYVFGGSDGYTDYNTTFIYHPKTGVWAIGAPLPVALESGMAIALSDGRLVVLGGGTGCRSGQSCTVYATAFVYTPASNAWSLLPSMQSPRYRFAAALGSDGRIYAIGGWDGHAALSSVEAFSFKTNSWTYVYSLPQAERAAAAAVDVRGHLYVLGGDNAADYGTVYYSNVYMYTNNGWIAEPAMPTAREDLTATRGPDGQIYAIGGYNNSGFLSTVEAYNPATGVWSSLAPLPAQTCCAVAVLLPNGRIAVVGGHAESPGIYTYGPLPASPVIPPIPFWSQPTSLLAIRTRPAVAITRDGTIYVFGGTDGTSTDYNTTLIYHPKTSIWTIGASMPFSLEGGAAVTLPDGRIVVLGGGTGCHGTQNCTIYGAVSMYSPRTNSWSLLPSMQSPRYRFAAVLGHDGRIYAIGGWDGHSTLSSIEAFNFHTNSWSYAYGLPQPTEAPAAALDVHGRLYVFGGYQDTNNGAVYYNNVWIANGSGWNIGAPMPTAREDMAAVRGPDGLMYILGGYNGSFLSTVEAYNPIPNAWIAVAPLPQVVCCLGAVATADHMYAIGGGTLVAVYGPFKVAAPPTPKKKIKK